jgi:hypothetical protein
MAHVYPVKLVNILLFRQYNLNLSAFDCNATDRFSSILKGGEQTQSALLNSVRRHGATPLPDKTM